MVNGCDTENVPNQEEFALTDKNKDGQVTLIELHKAIRAYDPAGIDFSNDGVIEWFKDLDTDKNGKITLFEYLLTLKRQAKQKNQERNMIAMRFRRYFDEADTNGNQKLSLAEAAAFATKYRFSEKKLLDAFNLSDKNKDKQLQFDEFVISFPAV
uniref:EF-hand domain-containing protein n=1 Tax=Plectus sambesii TaxID=2011161 RepID=A0A914VFH4_9BILA